MVHWKVAVGQSSPVCLVLGHSMQCCKWNCVSKMGFIGDFSVLWALWGVCVCVLHMDRCRGFRNVLDGPKLQGQKCRGDD